MQTPSSKNIPAISTLGSHQTIEPGIRLIISYSAKNEKATLKMSEQGQGQTATVITNGGNQISTQKDGASIAPH